MDPFLQREHDLAEYNEEHKPDSKDIRISDLVMLIRRMVVRFRMINDHAGDRLADQATDYLRRKGLANDASDILRSPNKDDDAQTEQDDLCPMCRVYRYRKNQALASSLKALEEALRGILELGRKDTSNPKYDGYYEQARAVLGENTKQPKGRE